MDLNNIKLKLISYFPNTSLSDLTMTLIIFFIALITIRFLRGPFIRLIEKLTKKTKNNYDDFIVTVIKKLPFNFYLILSFYISILFLKLPNKLFSFIEIFMQIFIVYYISKAIIEFISLIVDFEIKTKSKLNKSHDNTFLRLIGTFSKYFIFLIAVLFLLSNFGINISSLIAGLGIGGIAIALALQNILTDIFSSFTIYFDKPFQTGDFIVLDNGDMGTVGSIGIKSTRILTLHGHELIVSNRELTTARINNYKQMKRRRVVHEIGVTYDTSNKQLEKVPKLIQNIFDKVDNATYDRCHFKKFNSFSLDFELVYYMDVADYNAYMETQHQVNIKIKKEFEKEKIDFAYPTQTLFLNKNK